MLEHPKTVSARSAVQATRGTASAGAQTIDRAATLLLLVGRAGSQGARLSDLATQCDLPKPTVRRMLLAMVMAGLLDQDEETRRYHIGPEIFVLGNLASYRFGILPASMRSLLRLAQESGDTAFLSVPRDVYSICVHREEGAYPIRIHALHAGDRHPLGVGAASLAMLAALPDAEIEQVLAANADLLREKYAQITPDVLRANVARTRAQGHALNPGLLLAGSWGVGVAIRDAAGRPIGALSIAAIESRLRSDREHQLAALLTAEVRAVERRLAEGRIAARGGLVKPRRPGEPGSTGR